MIKITKPATPPEILQSRGRKKRAVHCRDYTRHGADYDAGTRQFSFAPEIYRHATVTQALRDAQHGKCCFCEQKIGAEGDVEHFRPKAACRQNEGQPLERPGYYWLAYDWQNLLWACPICNQRCKQNFFPLVDLAQRAKSHKADITQEQPLLIHPAEDDPAAVLSFRKEIAYPIGGNAQATETITRIGLNRPNLLERRREYLARLIYLRKVLDQETELASSEEGYKLLEEARIFLLQAVQDTAEFAAMARAASASGIIEPIVTRNLKENHESLSR